MGLRTAQISDASVLAAISIEVWLGTYIRQGVNAFFADYVLSEFTEEKFRSLIEDADEHIVVSENKDGLDGFTRISSKSAAPIDNCSTMEISTLYVQPRHHGNGIGRALLQEALRHARDAKVPSVWLTTNSENTSAINFYTSQGFERIGTTHFRIQNQAYLNDVFRYAFP